MRSVAGVLVTCLSVSAVFLAAVPAAATELIVLSSAAYDTGGSDGANAVVADVDDNIIVTGKTGNDFLTVKYNKGFTLVHSAVFNSGGDDVAYGVAVDSLGRIIVTGRSMDNYFTVKYDQNLQTVISSAVFDGGGQDFATAVAVDGGDNVIVTGYGDSDGTKNFRTIKYNAALQQMFSRMEDRGGDDRAAGLAVDAGNNIIVTGYAFNGETFDYFTVKYDGQLNQLAQAVYDSGKDDKAVGVTIDNQGRVIVTGYSSNGTDNDYCTVVYDGELNQVSVTRFDSGFNEIPRGVAVDSRDNIVVSGQQFDGGTWNLHTVKYDRDLQVLAGAVSDSGGNDYANAVTVDGQDNIIVVGQVFDGLTDNYYAVKYNGSPRVSSVSAAYQGETGTVRILGRGFLADTAVSFGDAGIATGPVSVVPQNQITVEVVVPAGVPVGTKTVTVTNSNGEASTAELFEVAARVCTGPDRAAALSATLERGSLALSVPAGAFVQVSTVTVSCLTAEAGAGGSKASPVGARISVFPADVPVVEYLISFRYDDGDIAGLDESKLAVGYYDEFNARWVSLPSEVYPGENRVTASTRFIGRQFAVVELTASDASLTGVKVYPNPYKPGSGTDFDHADAGEGIVFANIVREFKLRIFTVAGEEVFSTEGTTDASGSYLWDTRNMQGEKSVSGVYLYVLENARDSSQRLKGKIAIIR